MYSYKHIQNFAPEMPQIIDVFYDSFAASEGIDEGDLIQSIVKNLLGNTANSDLFVFGAIYNNSIIGCAIFSRLTYLNDPRNIFILSPMAVHPNHQNNGIGQNPLLESIGFLKKQGIDILMTYGDPAYYGKVGFLPVAEHVVPAPFPLSMPIDWIGQSLNEANITTVQGSCACVPALNNPAIW